jgi:hypothetical protein
VKAIEQKIAGQEIQRVEVEARPPTTDLVETLKASLRRKELAKVSFRKTNLRVAHQRSGRPSRPLLLWRSAKPARLRHADRFPQVGRPVASVARHSPCLVVPLG